MTEDEFFMQEALELAREAGLEGEVPIGALVVRNGEVIGRGYNMRELAADPLAHAELIAIQEAAETIDAWRLLDCTLYVTLEPCVMCAGAIVQSRIPNLVFGAFDPKGGGVKSLYQICNDDRMNHRVKVRGGVCEEDSAALLKEFFRARRSEKKVQSHGLTLVDGGALDHESVQGSPTETRPE